MTDTIDAGIPGTEDRHAGPDKNRNNVQRRGYARRHQIQHRLIAQSIRNDLELAALFNKQISVRMSLVVSSPLDPGHSAGFQLCEDLGGDFVIKARPVGAGTGASGES
jgi:hypothetical protein